MNYIRIDYVTLISHLHQYLCLITIKIQINSRIDNRDSGKLISSSHEMKVHSSLLDIVSLRYYLFLTVLNSRYWKFLSLCKLLISTEQGSSARLPIGELWSLVYLCMSFLLRKDLAYKKKKGKSKERNKPNVQLRLYAIATSLNYLLSCPLKKSLLTPGR